MGGASWRKRARPTEKNGEGEDPSEKERTGQLEKEDKLTKIPAWAQTEKIRGGIEGGERACDTLYLRGSAL